MEAAQEAGDKEKQAILNKQVNRVTPQMFEDAKKLLGLMGVPIVQVRALIVSSCEFFSILPLSRRRARLRRSVLSCVRDRRCGPPPLRTWMR